MNIIVNGDYVDWPDTWLTYEELVKEICNMSGYPSVTYHWKGQGDNYREGTLCKGEGVGLAFGMIFNCIHTGNA